MVQEKYLLQLKELLMQVAIEEIDHAVERRFLSDGYDVTDELRTLWREMIDTLREMDPEQDCDMTLCVCEGDASGYYSEDILKIHPDYPDGLCAMSTMPWAYWLGMEFDEKTLREMPMPDILAECIFEMSWWGFTEESIRRNLDETFGNKRPAEE